MNLAAKHYFLLGFHLQMVLGNVVR
uniref:Uncharacterized protein n=1 Tax=Anguilla anguilla TaxID=7936 RepID=A0A0E9TQK6_ANGAN